MREIKIGILMGDRLNPFWAEMKAQYDRIATKLGVSVHHFWPSSEDVGRSQLMIFMEMQSLGFDVIILNPINRHNLVSGIIHAASRGFYVLDVGAKTDQESVRDAKPYYTPVKTVNFYRQGVLGATYIVQRLRALGGGKVVIIEGRQDSVQSIGRSQGAADIFLKESSVHSIKQVPADFDREKAKEVALKILQQDIGVKAFFCTNDLMALGVSSAVTALNRQGQTIIVGVDLIKEAREAIRIGLMDASVAFSPASVARVVLESALKVFNGDEISDEFSVPSILITRDNIDSQLELI